jgi:predicted secreted protein
MQFNLFAWIREGVRRSVILGVNDAVEEIGAPHGDEAWKERLVSLLEAPVAENAAESAGVAAGKRRRLGRSLKDFTPE